VGVHSSSSDSRRLLDAVATRDSITAETPFLDFRTWTQGSFEVSLQPQKNRGSWNHVQQLLADGVSIYRAAVQEDEHAAAGSATGSLDEADP
jgi:hypothetical protein